MNTIDEIKNRKHLEYLLLKKAYNDKDFKKLLFTNPRKAVQYFLEEKLPKSVNIKLVDEASDTVVISIPAFLKEEDGELSDDFLDQVAGGRPCGSFSLGKIRLNPEAGVTSDVSW